jgi:hypothetical protein
LTRTVFIVPSSNTNTMDAVPMDTDATQLNTDPQRDARLETLSKMIKSVGLHGCFDCEMDD